MPYEKMISVEWLQKRILEDIYERKCDGLVFEKLNHYIHLYDLENEAKDDDKQI